jgi:hypothetical protein
MTQALLIKADGGIAPVTLPEENAYQTINSLVGGYIDCVTNGENIAGYVHDEGLLIGLAPNLVASVLFGRPLVGDCVVVGYLNERGEYDGNDYDVPAEFMSERFHLIAGLILNDERVRTAVETEVARIMDDPTPKVVSLTDDEFDAWLEGK